MDKRLPSGWSLQPLQALSRKPISYGIVQTGEPIADGIPCVRVVDLTSDHLDPSKMITTSQSINRSYRRTILEKDEILFALRGDIGSACLVPDHLVGANITRGIARISPIQDQICPRYLIHALASPDVQKSIRHLVNGSALQEIPIVNLRRLPVVVPTRGVQEAIAAIGDLWDSSIRTLGALIKAKQGQKAGLMQQLLTGKRRFREFIAQDGTHHTPCGDLPRDWPVVSLHHIFREVKNKNGSTTARVLTASGQHGMVDQLDFFNRSVAGRSLDGYYLLRRGEFAYNRSLMTGYPFGAIKRLDRYECGCSVSGQMAQWVG